MKIVCDSCGAKYSIADEKVQGKVFKIRCKKCSNVIVVKGTADEASAGGDLGGSEAAEWYVVIDGEQVGPVTTVEIDSYFMSGRIAVDTYAWKDGMGDWKHIVDIPEFAHLGGDVAGPNEATTIADAGQRFADDGEADATNVMQSPLALGETSDATVGDSPAAMGFSDPYPSDPGGGYDDEEFGYAASSTEDDGGYAGFSGYDSGGGLAGLGGDLAAAGGDDDGGAGMFAAFDTGGDSSDFMSFGDSGGAADVPTNGSNGSNGAPVGEAMVGQRNENSVLFSLSSLDSVPAVGGGDDKPVTEGSGLIDIQALATAHKSMSDAGSDAGGGIDPFAQGTMAMPALMPMGSHRSNKGLYAGLAAAGVAVLALIGVVIYMVASKEEPKPATPTTVIREVITEKIIESPDKKKAEAEAAEAEKAALAAAAATKANKVEDAEPDKANTPKKSSSHKKTSSHKKSQPKEDVAPPPKKKKDGIDSILDKIDKKGAAAKKKDTSSGSSKKALSRNDVKKTINRYGSRINTCAKSQNKSGKKGTIKVKFFIRPNGRVRGATVVSSGFKGTDVGGCVQKVVGSMTFPKTSASKDVPVTYPFILK